MDNLVAVELDSKKQRLANRISDLMHVEDSVKDTLKIVQGLLRELRDQYHEAACERADIV